MDELRCGEAPTFMQVVNTTSYIFFANAKACSFPASVSEEESGMILIEGCPGCR